VRPPSYEGYFFPIAMCHWYRRCWWIGLRSGPDLDLNADDLSVLARQGMTGTGMQRTDDVRNCGGRGVVSISSLGKAMLAWRCRLFDCRGVPTSSAVGNESGPSGMMTVWPPALIIWSIQASTAAFNSQCECMWAPKRWLFPSRLLTFVVKFAGRGCEQGPVGLVLLSRVIQMWGKLWNAAANHTSLMNNAPACCCLESSTLASITFPDRPPFRTLSLPRTPPHRLGMHVATQKRVY
jgi:hypothetical protein